MHSLVILFFGNTIFGVKVSLPTLDPSLEPLVTLPCTPLPLNTFGTTLQSNLLPLMEKLPQSFNLR